MKRFKSFLLIVLIAICFVGCNPIVGGTTPEPEPIVEPATEPYVNPDLSDQYVESDLEVWVPVKDNGFDWQYSRARLPTTTEEFYIIAFSNVEDFYKKIGNRNMVSLNQSGFSVSAMQNAKAIIVVKSLENADYISSSGVYNRSYFGILENSNDTNFTKYIKDDNQTYTLEWLKWFQERTKPGYTGSF